MGIYSTSPRIYTVDYGINPNKDKKGAYNPEARTKSIRVGNVPELRGSAHCARSHSIPKIQQTHSGLPTSCVGDNHIELQGALQSHLKQDLSIAYYNAV